MATGGETARVAPFIVATTSAPQRMMMLACRTASRLRGRTPRGQRVG